MDQDQETFLATSARYIFKFPSVLIKRDNYEKVLKNKIPEWMKVKFGNFC